MEYPLIFLDLETTGTNTQEDRIVEICMVKDTGTGEPIIKRTLVNPEIAIPKEASDIHGIKDQDVKDAPKFRQMAKSLVEFIEGCDLVGYNLLTFDVPMLYAELTRAGVQWKHSQINIIDACAIFKRKEERTLTAAVKFYLHRDHTGAHGAESDTQATIDVLAAQVERYPDLPKTNQELALFSNYDKPRYDLAGCFTKDQQGEWLLNFGKNKGKKAKEQRPYLEWMEKQSFAPDTKSIIHSVLWGKKNK